jgi:Tfp pilus assembly protein PilF
MGYRLLLILPLFLVGCLHVERDQRTEYNEDGVFLYKNGSYNEARQMFQAALALKPGDPNILFNIGQCYEHLHQPELAERAFQECLTSDPDHLECRHAMAVLLWETHRPKDCQKLIENYLAKHPQLAAANVEMGWYYRQIGDVERAMSWYQRAYSFDSANIRVLVELAQFYEGLNESERALVLYERALEIDPNQPDVKLQLAATRLRFLTLLNGQKIARFGKLVSACAYTFLLIPIS